MKKNGRYGLTSFWNPLQNESHRQSNQYLSIDTSCSGSNLKSEVVLLFTKLLQCGRHKFYRTNASKQTERTERIDTIQTAQYEWRQRTARTKNWNYSSLPSFKKSNASVATFSYIIFKAEKVSYNQHTIKDTIGFRYLLFKVRIKF